ncbi:MAG: CxxC-x17-CxxC domain-containing protein [Patescibacteria group bacterium]|nr:CxxC-x17-CxxC domain-containing protein [Patescibacteria group bacterium]
MHQGKWTCSECGTEITELPFEPDGQRPIYCRQCHQKRRQNRGGGRGQF